MITTDPLLIIPSGLLNLIIDPCQHLSISEYFILFNFILDNEPNPFHFVIPIEGIKKGGNIPINHTQIPLELFGFKLSETLRSTRVFGITRRKKLSTLKGFSGNFEGLISLIRPRILLDSRVGNI